MRIKYLLLYWFNCIRFLGNYPRCTKCGYPMEVSRPYTLDPDTGDIEASYYYQCNCTLED